MLLTVSCDSLLYPISKPAISLLYYDRINETCIVEIKNNSESGLIYYTTDESDLSNTVRGYYYQPSTYTYNSVTYEGISVGIGKTVKAAIYEGNSIKSKNATLKLDKSTIPVTKAPTVSAIFKADTDGKLIVQFQENSNSEVYYTVDGTNPTVRSTKYAPVALLDSNNNWRTGILVQTGTILKAFSISPNKIDSEIISYKAESVPDQDEIMIKNHGLLADNEQYHIIEISIEGPFVIRWTDSSSKITQSSKRYTPKYYMGADGVLHKGILIKKSKTLKAAAFDQEGYKISEQSLTVISKDSIEDLLKTQ